MRKLLVPLAALALALPLAAGAGPVVGGKVTFGHASGGNFVGGKVVIGKGPVAKTPAKPGAGKGTHPRRPFGKGFGRRPLFFAYGGSYESEWDRYRNSKRVVVTPTPTPVPPPEPEPVAAPSPPDLRGPRFTPARGLRRAQAPLAEGGFLPRRLPVVSLDWRSYELPEPGPGELYVRVSGQVLLIDPASRRILRRVSSG
ncbi:MAG: RcnB family protein [Pseudomonadota bacterium]